MAIDNRVTGHEEAPATTSPGRSPKLDALDVLAGDWVLADPSSPGGRTSFTWLEGGFFLVQRWTVSVPPGRPTASPSSAGVR